MLLNWRLAGGYMDQKLLDEINERVRAVLAQGPAADVEKNLRAMLAGLFSRLDLVRRDEFDVQREVLARTRGQNLPNWSNKSPHWRRRLRRRRSAERLDA